MLGLSEAELFSIIDNVAGSAHATTDNLKRQSSVEPRDILARLAAGVAKAIEANNKAIEEQLKR